MKQFLSTLIFCSVFLSAAANASMSLNRVIVHFDSDKAPREDIVVTNPDDEPLYLQTEVYQVENPGEANEKLVQITDPDKMKLLVAPQKTIIPPGTRKTVRLVSLETPEDEEAVYRVTFKPVVGDLEATQTAIKILIAYQALIFVRPDEAVYDVQAQREGEKLTFTNQGNINVVLRNGYYCANKNFKREECAELSQSVRLYAGQQWLATLPETASGGTGEVRYGMFDGTNERQQIFPLSTSR